MAEPSTRGPSVDACPCGCGALAVNGVPMADHPHTDPGDGRKECLTCGKWVHEVTHSCKGVAVTIPALRRYADAATGITKGSSS